MWTQVPTIFGHLLYLISGEISIIFQVCDINPCALLIKIDTIHYNNNKLILNDSPKLWILVQDQVIIGAQMQKTLLLINHVTEKLVSMIDQCQLNWNIQTITTNNKD